jgi:glycosyltransferase involved in cell wall biosynthesis
VKRHEHVASEGEMVALLRAARGFVLKSRFENWCLAAHEAAACGLPLLLPDLRWARERFGNSVSYFPKTAGGGDAKALRAFYDQSLKLPPPQARLFSWREVAERLREVYARLLPASSAPATFRSTSQ